MYLSLKIPCSFSNCKSEIVLISIITEPHDINFDIHGFNICLFLLPFQLKTSPLHWTRFVHHGELERLPGTVEKVFEKRAVEPL